MGERQPENPPILRLLPFTFRAADRARPWPVKDPRKDNPGARAGWALGIIARHGAGIRADVDDEARLFLLTPKPEDEVAPAPSIPTAPRHRPLPPREAAPARVIERILRREVECIVFRDRFAMPQFGRTGQPEASRGNRHSPERPDIIYREAIRAGGEPERDRAHRRRPDILHREVSRSISPWPGEARTFASLVADRMSPADVGGKSPGPSSIPTARVPRSFAEPRSGDGKAEMRRNSTDVGEVERGDLTERILVKQMTVEASRIAASQAIGSRVVIAGRDVSRNPTQPSAGRSPEKVRTVALRLSQASRPIHPEDRKALVTRHEELGRSRSIRFEERELLAPRREEIGRRSAVASRLEWDPRDGLPANRTDRSSTWEPTRSWSPVENGPPARILAKQASVSVAAGSPPTPPSMPGMLPPAMSEAAPLQSPFARPEGVMSQNPRPPFSLASFPPADVQRLTDQVVRAMDQRLLAHRERFGRA